MKQKSVHYLWFLDETGFLQSYQITSQSRTGVRRKLDGWLGMFADQGRGAAVVEVTLDEEEKAVTGLDAVYNGVASSRLRALVKRLMGKYRVSRELTREVIRLLPAGKKAGRKPR